MKGGNNMKHRVYIAASTQKENVGVGQYGNEQDRMQFLANRIVYWLSTQTGKFTTFRNQPGWSLQQTINDCNKLACQIFIDNHTNAGPSGADGTEVYYHRTGTGGGKKLAECLFTQIGPLSPGSDRGVLSDLTLYTNGLAVLRQTTPPAALIEHIYHSNIKEVQHYLNNIEAYAKATAIGICNYFGEKWIEPSSDSRTSVFSLVDEMFRDGLITDKGYWYKVLQGEIPPKPEYLQILFGRMVSKIG